MSYQEMKDELWRAFSRNLPIKVNIIENGRMVLKEISPDSNDYSDMYIKQSAYLNDKIHSSSVDSIMSGIQNNYSDSVNKEVEKIMDEIHSNVEGTDSDDKSLIDDHSTESTSTQQSNKDLEKKDINGNIALVKKGDIVIVIGEITEKELREENNPVCDLARTLGNKITVCNTVNCNTGVNYSIKGISFILSKEGKILISGDFDKAEYMDYSSSLPHIDLDIILKNASMGHKTILSALLAKYGIDNIWMDIADSLKNKKISKEKYEEFVANLKKMFSKEECEKYKIFSNEHFKDLSNGDILYDDGSQKIDVLSEDNIDHKTAPSKAKKAEPNHMQKVKSRKVASDSLKNKFLTKVDKAREWWGGLSPRTKGIIIASTIAVVGVGILVLNASTIKDLLDGANSSFNFSSFNSVTTPIDKITEQIQSNVSNIHNTINNIQSSVVNWDVIGEGHVGYKTAADAFNHMNGVILNRFFGKEPSSGIIDVYNMVTGWMHLTKEQLNDPELLKTLSQDPNNVIHIKDAWFNLSDILSEIIKGGKVL